MLKRNLILISVLLFSRFCFSSDTTINSNPKIYLLFGINSSYTDFNKLNNIFSNNNISTLSCPQDEYNFGFLIQFTPYRSLLEVKYGFLNNLNNSNKLVSLINTQNFESSLLYNILKSQNLLLLPQLAFGEKTYNIDIYDKSHNNSNVFEVIQNPKVINIHSNNIYYIKIGMGIEKRVHLLNNDISIGAAGLYFIPINAISWKTKNDSSIMDFPKIRMKSFNLFIHFGYSFNNLLFREKSH